MTRKFVGKKIDISSVRIARDYFRLFNDILTSISRDWHNCGSIEFNVRIMTNKANLSHRYSMLIIGIYSIAVIVYVSVIMELNFIDSNGSNKTEDQLFLKMKFPFVYDVSPIHEIVMIFQFVQLLSNASVIGMLDALIITLVSSSLFMFAFDVLLDNNRPIFFKLVREIISQIKIYVD